MLRTQLDAGPVLDGHHSWPDTPAVEVRTRFDGRWASGFELIGTETDDNGERYLVRRRSDHAILPATFARDEIRWPPGLNQSYPDRREVRHESAPDDHPVARPRET